MKAVTPQERADRWQRRAWGFVDRNTFAWSFAALEAALRDLRRELAKGLAPLLDWFARRLPS